MYEFIFFVYFKCMILLIKKNKLCLKILVDYIYLFGKVDKMNI